MRERENKRKMDEEREKQEGGGDRKVRGRERLWKREEEIRESRVWNRKNGRGKGEYGKWKERRGRIGKKRCSKEGDSVKRIKD